MDNKAHIKLISRTLIVLLLFVAVGCKSSKQITSSGELNSKLTSKQLIKEHNKKDPKFKTLQARVKVDYIQGDHSQSYTINLRMEKDKTIWLSATLGIVRAKITPTKVSFYNKLDNTYFDGDFSLISDLLGTKLDFEKVQNILLGNAIYKLKSDHYNTSIHEGSYVLSPINQNQLFEIFYLLNPTHFKIDSQQLAQPLEQRMLEIDYKSYQEVKKQIVPQNVKVIALERDFETVITMEFKSVSLNSKLNFPFRIPHGFQEIMIK
jgi:outer membrane biogenesis lipoprotein LolB